MSINDSQIQMTLDLDSDLLTRFRSVKEVVAAGTYRRGLKRTANDLDLPSGNLSVALSGDGQRHFDTDWLETYIEKSGDKTPIYYLVAKYCGDSSASRDEALERVQSLLGELPALLANVGLNTKKARR